MTDGQVETIGMAAAAETAATVDLSETETAGKVEIGTTVARTMTIAGAMEAPGPMTTAMGTNEGPGKEVTKADTMQPT